MKRGTLNIIVLCSVAALGIGAVVVWLAWSVESGVQERIPVEHKPLFKTRQSTQFQNTGTLIRGPGKPSDDVGSGRSSAELTARTSSLTPPLWRAIGPLKGRAPYGRSR